MDISQGATLPMSDASGRDMTVMAISEEGLSIECFTRRANTFGPEPDGSDNFLYVMDGRNYAARMYRSRSAILGSWSFPEPEPSQLPAGEQVSPYVAWRDCGTVRYLRVTGQANSIVRPRDRRHKGSGHR